MRALRAPRAPLRPIWGAMGATWAGPASRVPTFRPSSHARTAGLPPAGRVHAYLLCSGKTRLSRSRGKGGLTALAIRSSPRPRSVPPRRIPAPSVTTPNPSTHSRTQGPSFLHHFAAATTLGSPKPLNSQCRPGCDVPPNGQAARAPPPRARSVSTPRIPDCSPSGVPHGSAPVPVLPRYRLHSAAGQRRDLPVAATARQCGGRGARGAEPESSEPRARREPAIGSAPCAAPPILGSLSRPPSHRAPTLAGVTAPPPKERWGRALPKLIEARTLALQSGDLGHNYFCLLSSPARIPRGGTGASEGQDTTGVWRNSGRECCGCGWC